MPLDEQSCIFDGYNSVVGGYLETAKEGRDPAHREILNQVVGWSCQVLENSSLS